jgi:chloramphenicol-sensitive protein RarD
VNAIRRAPTLGAVAISTSAASDKAPPVESQYPEFRRGVLFGIAAYGLWGMFPLYWTLLPPAAAVEILAHRIAWSLLAVLAALWFVGRRRGTGLRELRTLLRDRRRLLLLSLAAIALSFNWGIYIWAVNHGQVVEASLGYFINPLFTVIVSVLFLGERLRGWQWVAVGLGTVAVVVLTVGYGRLPWIALILASTFAFYGLVRKFVAVGATESQVIETSVMLLPAVGYLVVLEASGAGTFVDHGVGHALLLAGTGLVSAAPLLAFGAAALRMPLSVLGLLQYLAPVLQFLLGVLVFGEHMPPERWFGFALVWLALTVLTFDGLHSRVSAARPRRTSSPTPTTP